MENEKQKKIIAYLYGPILFAWRSRGCIDGSIILTNNKAIELVKEGHRGLSPGLKITEFRCSICNQDYEKCEHEEGEKYENDECFALVHGWEGQEVSLVDTPEDPRARVTDMLVIENNGKKSEYTWYGYEVDNDNRRFQHIQKAKDNKLISEKIALRLSNYFLENRIGEIKIS